MPTNGIGFYFHLGDLGLGFLSMADKQDGKDELVHVTHSNTFKLQL